MIEYRKAVLLFVMMAFAGSAQSEMSAIAFSKDEAMHENNISKPRIFIQNTGNVPITNFFYRYYFTAENGNMPVLENYYTPNETVTLEYFGGNRYAVRHDCFGITLMPGAVFPDPNGDVVGIHYQNWEPLCKVNDRSCNFSDEFTPNNGIEVFAAEGLSINAPHYHVQHERQMAVRETPEPASINIAITVKR